MPRPSDITVKSQNDNFGPSQYTPEAVDTRVPLNVTTAGAAKAEMLAKTFGLANETFQKGNEFETEKSNQQGALDQTLGQTDPAKAAQNQAYANGAARISIQNSTIQAINQVEQKAKTDWANLPLHTTTDHEGNPVPGLVERMDAEYRNLLGGLEHDPQAAAIMTPLIQHSMNEVAGARVKQQTEQQLQMGLDNAGALAMRQAVRQDGSFNWSEQVTTLANTPANAGDKHKAVAQLMSVLSDAMIQSHDPKFMDKIGLPDKITLADGQVIDGPLHIAGYSEQIEVARDKARTLQKQDQEVAVRSKATEIMDGILKGQNPTQGIHQYNDMPGADPHFTETAYDFWKHKDEQGVNDALMSPAVAKITNDVLTHKITTTEQLAQASKDARLPPKAFNKVMTQGLEVLRGTQSTDQNSEEVREGSLYLSKMYDPGNDPLIGKFERAQAVTQQQAALMAFHKEVNAQIQQGKSPADATQAALDKVTKDNDPILMKKGSAAPATTDAQKGDAVRNIGSNPERFMSSHIDSKELDRLFKSGAINHDEQVAAANWLLEHVHN